MAAAPVTPPGWKVPDEWKHLHEDQLVEAVPLNETDLQVQLFKVCTYLDRPMSHMHAL